MTLNPGEELILPDYVRTYTEFDSIHSNVSNTFKISFTVDSASDEVVAGEQNAQTGETVCFGECPQFQNGCWPTDGIVYTEPYEPDLNTHKATDAFDISGNAGNPVFAIFEGTAYFYPEGSGVFAGAANGAYGNHVFIASEDAEGKALALIYAHLNSLSMSQGPHEIAAGTYLGDVGNTGNSRGPHLHFEIRTDVADYTLPDHAPNFYHAFNDRFTINQVGPTGLPEPYYTAPNYEAPIAGTRVRPTLLDRITPEGEEEDGLVVFGEKVRTCYQR
jgi:murein DD-endopeptidase MepM/ murein hydrolase activator NlpD